MYSDKIKQSGSSHLHCCEYFVKCLLVDQRLISALSTLMDLRNVGRFSQETAEEAVLGCKTFTCILLVSAAVIHHHSKCA